MVKVRTKFYINADECCGLMGRATYEIIGKASNKRGNVLIIKGVKKYEGLRFYVNEKEFEKAIDKHKFEEVKARLDKGGFVNRMKHVVFAITSKPILLKSM